LTKILALGGNPRPQDVKLLRRRGRTYRVHSGEYRILYEIDDAAKTVLVFRVGHRREVYRNL
jgi:mRNA interferase RelE/StbE